MKVDFNLALREKWDHEISLKPCLDSHFSGSGSEKKKIKAEPEGSALVPVLISHPTLSVVNIESPFLVLNRHNFFKF